MGFLQRFRRQDEPQEETLSHAAGHRRRLAAEECTACGWDLREAYHAPTPTPETDRA